MTLDEKNMNQSATVRIFLVKGSPTSIRTAEISNWTGKAVAGPRSQIYFGFYSPDLEGFSGIGHSVEDCFFKAKLGMKEHVELLKQEGLPVPTENSDPKIIVQNEKKTAVA